MEDDSNWDRLCKCPGIDATENFYKLLDSSKLVYKPGKFGREGEFKLLTVDTATVLKFVTFDK
ncbi:hypothetical protein NQ315_008752 [Exocentrus adspersus]|uniref:Uncharacterized protein n=1 Tax=Exocentrus adspersus TaxID=1586481 RepID=A0AAV8VH05_9CUCU|nr:hypothetical protein NQ315_008752 [Exocentrus adspersus]